MDFQGFIELFAENFDQLGELGASVCIRRNGEVILHLAEIYGVSSFLETSNRILPLRKLYLMAFPHSWEFQHYLEQHIGVNY